MGNESNIHAIIFNVFILFFFTSFFSSLNSKLTLKTAAVVPNTSYVALRTSNKARKYEGLSLAVIGGSLQTVAAIPANTPIVLATVGDPIKPIAQHNVGVSNDHFIQNACWMGINGSINFFAQTVIPVGAYIHFGDCYVYNHQQ